MKILKYNFRFHTAWKLPQGSVCRVKTLTLTYKTYKRSCNLMKTVNVLDMAPKKDSAEPDNEDYVKLFRQSKKGKPKLFVRNVITSVLAESINQLSVLRILNQKEGDVFAKDTVKYETIGERYGESKLAAKYRGNMNYDVYLSKLPTDINMLINIYVEAINEIKLNGKCTTMTEAVNALNKMKEDDSQILTDEYSNIKLLKEIKCNFEKERLNNIKTIRKTNGDIQVQKFNLEDYVVYNAEEMKYFEQWEKSRVEQNEISCLNKENEFQSAIQNAENKIELENRCHNEIIRFLEESKNDYLNDIQNWMKQYDDDIEKKDNDIILMKSGMEKISKDCLQLQKEFDEHGKFIEEWLEHKRILREQEEHEQLENWAATKIQAWWRGEMYRKKLGPYRKKKKGKGKKGKGKGKKGKK